MPPTPGSVVWRELCEIVAFSLAEAPQHETMCQHPSLLPPGQKWRQPKQPSSCGLCLENTGHITQVLFVRFLRSPLKFPSRQRISGIKGTGARILREPTLVCQSPRQFILHLFFSYSLHRAAVFRSHESGKGKMEINLRRVRVTSGSPESNCGTSRFSVPSLS